MGNVPIEGPGPGLRAGEVGVVVVVGHLVEVLVEEHVGEFAVDPPSYANLRSFSVSNTKTTIF